MKPKFLCSIAVAVLLSVAAFPQAGNSNAALPAAPGTDPAPAAPVFSPTATKVAVVNVEMAIFACNEGQRDMGALQKKFEPKRTELGKRKDDIDSLRKQMEAAGTTDAKKAELQREIDQKQKSLERDAQDAQEDYSGQQSVIGQNIFKKMGPVILKYAQANSLGLIIDNSTQWPNGPVLWANPASIDITKAIIDAYNVESGVPAPPAATEAPAKPSSTTRPPATKPSTTK
jgi:outer membrane protein